MRLLPILAAASLGLFATAAIAQNMDTSNRGNPNRAPSMQDKRAKKMTTGQNMDTSNRGNPNRAPAMQDKRPKATTTGQAQKMDTVQQGNPNRPSAGQTVGASHKTMKKSKKKHAKHM